MSLFNALSEMVGGIVLASAPACDLSMPPEALGERARFIAWLSLRGEIKEIRTVVDALGRDLWTGTETRGLAHRDLERHVKVTGDLVAEHPPGATELAEMARSIRAGGVNTGPAAKPVGRRIADDILSRATRAGAVAQHGILPEVAHFLIDRAVSHLTGEGQPLLRLGIALSDYALELEPATKGAEATGSLASLGVSKPFAQRLEMLGGLEFLLELGERYGLSESAMKRLVALIDSQSVPHDERATRLEQLAHWLGEVRAQLLRPSNDDVDIRRRKTTAAAALADGDFEAAMEALRLVRRELREARRKTEERLQEDALALKSQMLEEARATARLAELLAARGEHAKAAELFAEATVALPRSDRDTSWRFSLQRADSLLQHARAKSDAMALSEALSAYGQLVRIAAETTNSKALAEACLGHGDALALAGEREAGTGRLKDAVTIYQKAVQLLERERDTAALARARLALAKAFATLGERDRATETLHKAAQAFRDAAEFILPDKRPSDFAALKMGLGGMLVLIAIEERDGGSVLLEEATEAYRAALEILDQESDTETWGEAQFNLGLALLGLGEQEGASQHYLEDAVAAFRAALEAMPRIRVPQRWALAQMNLGNALAALGDRDPTGTSQIEAAIEAYSAALEEMVRENDPMKWAITQMNLGGALIRLGERVDKRRHWLAAASALVPALEVFETERAEQFAEMTRRNLKRFQDSWDSFIGIPKSGTPETGQGDGQREPMRMAKNA